MIKLPRLKNGIPQARMVSTGNIAISSARARIPSLVASLVICITMGPAIAIVSAHTTSRLENSVRGVLFEDREYNTIAHSSIGKRYWDTIRLGDKDDEFFLASKVGTSSPCRAPRRTEDFPLRFAADSLSNHTISFGFGFPFISHFASLGFPTEENEALELSGLILLGGSSNPIRRSPFRFNDRKSGIAYFWDLPLLPYTLSYKGLLLNCMSVFLALESIRFTFCKARATIRASRGQCRVCGHILKNARICPECGIRD